MVPNCPLLCLQRSFTLIVEAWDWDNDTTPDGEFAGSQEAGVGCCLQAPLRAPGGGPPIATEMHGARFLILCLLGTRAQIPGRLPLLPRI